MSPSTREQLHSFTIHGPPAKLAYLQRKVGMQNGQTLSGVMSPSQRITLRDSSRVAAGIPAAAVSVMFAYPLPELAEKMSEVLAEGRREPWLFFCILGGFCYLDHNDTLIQTNAFVLTTSPSVSSLHFSAEGSVALTAAFLSTCCTWWARTPRASRQSSGSRLQEGSRM